MSRLSRKNFLWTSHNFLTAFLWIFCLFIDQTKGILGELVSTKQGKTVGNQPAEYAENTSSNESNPLVRLREDLLS